MSLKEMLGEELFEQVQEKLDEGTDLIVNDGDYIPRERLNDKQDKIEMLEEQLEERDNQIDQLKEDTNATEELQNKIEELQDKNEQTREDLQQQLQQQKKEDEIEKALLKNKARNPQAVKALLDDDSLDLTDDGELKGLEDQLKTLQENESYLFEDEDTGSKAGNDFKGGGNEGKLTMQQIDGMSEDEINDNWDEVKTVLENNK